jgi:hypothetical protein
MSDASENVGRPEPDVGPERKPYERPRILSRETLEAVASVCSPVGKGNSGLCPQGPISS